VLALIDGDATANNIVTVTNALFGGGSLVGSPTLKGGATGSLSGIVTLTDIGSFNEYFHEFTPGSSLSFVLDFTTNFAGGTPDSVSFLLIDNSTGLPIPTLAPLGSDVLFAIDLNGPSPAVQTYGTDPQRTDFALAAPVASAATVPEPGSLFLCGTVLCGVALFSRRRTRRLSKRALLG